MRSAAQLLVQHNVDLAAVQTRLPDAHLRTPVYVTPAWLDRAWGDRALAMTLPWGIYMPAHALAADPELFLHELVHVQQWQRRGVVRFGIRYLAEYAAARLKGRSHLEAYSGISFEREARSVAAELRAALGPRTRGDHHPR